MLASAIFFGGFSFSATAATKAAQEKGKIIKLTKTEFDKRVCNTNGQKWEYIGDKPCVIDFFATWCGPCKMITPFLSEFAEKYKDEMYVYQVNVDEEKALAQMFGAYSIPLLIFVPAKGEPQAQRGALPKDQLEQAIKTAVLNK